MNYDVAIVGGGHNGLVAAYYLAREGLKTIVLERRDIVGGCCVTEEFAPGYKASTGAYVLSMLREEIWSDMKLVERGIVVDPAGPSLHLFADGTRLQLSDDTDEAVAAIREFSEADAAACSARSEKRPGTGGVLLAHRPGRGRRQRLSLVPVATGTGHADQ